MDVRAVTSGALPVDGLRKVVVDRLRDLNEADRYYVLYGLAWAHPVESLRLLDQLQEQDRTQQEADKDD